jgi:nitric oxide reductase NorD protein
VGAGTAPWTDTERLFLPPCVARFDDPDDNRRLYRALVVMLWAQARFGTWAVARDFDPSGSAPPLLLQRALAETGDPPAELLARVAAAETLRLDACVARTLPGVHRDLQRLLALAGERLVPPGWETHAARLRDPAAGLAESLAAARAARGLPPPLCYRPELHPEAVADTVRARLARQRRELGHALWRLLHEPHGAPAAAERSAPERTLEARPAGPDLAVELHLDGQPLAAPLEVTAHLQSLLQDFGEIPPAFLVAAGPGQHDAEARRAPGAAAPDETAPESGACLYDEWDCHRKSYRKGWCVLRESALPPGDPGFRDATLARYSHLVKQLRRSFEALRGADRRQRRQPAGDGLDLDALVEAHADALRGRETGEQFYTRIERVERSIAVLFMVDMSGSTKGWINAAEREALVLLCEALERLGDRYAIYGFSGWTRKRCEVYAIETFDTPYDADVQCRIAAIEARDYTRMGVAIRHLAARLNQVDARTRLLVTLSDGRPEDYDHYRGRYGIEDTRMALVEARRTGIHPFCITIDSEGGDYLPHMYGPASYVVVDDVAKLPFKVADIYRRLTS